MSFIPHRDVFNMSKEDIEKADKLYDEIEARWFDDWAEDEYGRDWTMKRVREETGNTGPFGIGGYDMMIYMLNLKEKENGIQEG